MFKTSRNVVIAVVSRSLLQSLFAADRYEASEPHMGTLVRITLYAESLTRRSEHFTPAFARIAQLNRILSDYDPESELSRACEADTRSVPICLPS